MIRLISLLLVINALGCATASRMNRVALGMDKAAVIEKLGEPDSMKAGNGVEVMEYILSATDNAAFVGAKSPYWIVLRDGKVIQYGRAGDFGTAANPTLNLNVQSH